MTHCSRVAPRGTLGVASGGGISLPIDGAGSRSLSILLLADMSQSYHRVDSSGRAVCAEKGTIDEPGPAPAALAAQMMTGVEPQHRRAVRCCKTASRRHFQADQHHFPQ